MQVLNPTKPYNRNTSSLAHWIACLAILIPCAGCGSDPSDGLDAMQSQVASLSGKLSGSHFGVAESVSDETEVPVGNTVSKTEMPSPGRTNAFEMSGEFHSDTPTEELGAKREVYIIGFIEVDEPNVMLAIDGRTHVLKKGDTFERLKVEEIEPPRAKLSCDGVSWNASIFDRRNLTSEVPAKKNAN